jgi:hypothetical protein
LRSGVRGSGGDVGGIDYGGAGGGGVVHLNDEGKGTGVAAGIGR